ncbi:complement receptor type 1 isoform X1 [Tachysurus fulvidraco]|uniref:complement receptor type 1 isoform X1 n=1 Tax=Tachysurus fulvidraco TaxID=1234273 RepID=UPI000F4F879D|nr:complement receptor type 1 isoform X1 [Tachysurus fulvidraco]
MAGVLWTLMFFIFSSHLVDSYPGGKCGTPTLYSGKLLEEKYSRRRVYNSGERVQYKCELGYTHDRGSRSSVCNNGVWSLLELRCKKKLCGSAGEILNGQFRQTGNVFGDIAEAECNPGYVLQGEPIRECRVNGWTGTIPTCVAGVTPAIECSPTMRSKNAVYHATKATYQPGETLVYSCHVGFRSTSDSNVLQCDRTGKWKPGHANCQKIKCERFTIPNGKVKFGHLTFNVKVNISCKNGFHLQGPSVVTCGAEGSWTPALPTCEQAMPKQLTCPPPAVPNSIRQDRYKMEYVVGEHATVSCQLGFGLIGSSRVMCGADGQWQEIPECRFVGVNTGRCQLPPYLANAHTEHVEPNISVRFKCNPGYRMVRGPSTVYCRNGRWTDLNMLCERKKCGSAGEVKNGLYQYTGSLFGDTVTVRCNKGYQLVGAGVRNCTENGWNGREPVCEAIQCPYPDTVPDADLIFATSGIVQHGYVASYRCRIGTLIGESDIYCTEDGTWSAPAPRCEVATCSAPSVRNGLIVSGVRPRYHSGSSVTFMCNPGKKLLGPDIITCRRDGQWFPRLPICSDILY